MKLLDFVALTQNESEKGLRRGQVRTIGETLAAGVFEVAPIAKQASPRRATRIDSPLAWPCSMPPSVNSVRETPCAKSGPLSFFSSAICQTLPAGRSLKGSFP